METELGGDIAALERAIGIDIDLQTVLQRLDRASMAHSTAFHQCSGDWASIASTTERR